MPDPLTAVRRRLPAGGQVQVFTDFDGTLVDLVSDPLHVELSREVRAALEAAAVCPRLRLAVVSGRDLANLQDRVRLPRIAYAGNHGLEISTPDTRFVEPTARQRVDELARIVTDLRAALPGVWVQDKRLTATVHGPPALLSAVEHVVAGQFLVRTGRATIDVRPPVNWHKGAAVQWLRDRWADLDAVPVFLGDDPTDEDGFAACQDGVTVLVGPERPTRATHRLPTPLAVAGFLQGLVGLLDEQGS